MMYPDPKGIVAGLGEKHKGSDCACSRLATWLPEMRLDLEEAVRDGPSSAQHKSRTRLVCTIGAALMFNSHPLEAQPIVLETFEQ